MSSLSKRSDKSDKLHDNIQLFNKGRTDTLNGVLIMGKALYNIFFQRLWNSDSTGARNFDVWVENELGLSKSSARAMIDAYGKYGEIIEASPEEFAQLEISKVYLLLPHTPDDMSVSEKENMLHMAMSNTWRGLRDNLREMSGKTATDDCDHPSDHIETISRCKNCGKWLKD